MANMRVVCYSSWGHVETMAQKMSITSLPATLLHQGMIIVGKGIVRDLLAGRKGGAW